MGVPGLFSYLRKYNKKDDFDDEKENLPSIEKFQKQFQTMDGRH
jgi:hypothetical protein